MSEDLPRVLEVWETSVRAIHHCLTEEGLRFFKPLLLPHVPGLLCVRDDAGSSRRGGWQNRDTVHPPGFPEPRDRPPAAEHLVGALGATTLDVNEHNDQALAFYFRVGLEVEGLSELDGTGRRFHCCLSGYTSIELRTAP